MPDSPNHTGGCGHSLYTAGPLFVSINIDPVARSGQAEPSYPDLDMNRELICGGKEFDTYWITKLVGASAKPQGVYRVPSRTSAYH